MPALLRRDKTCCWWVGGEASRAASGERANKRPAACAELHAPSTRRSGCGLAGGRDEHPNTPTLPVLLMGRGGAGSCGAGRRVVRGWGSGVAAERVGALRFLPLIHGFDAVICRAFLEPC